MKTQEELRVFYDTTLKAQLEVLDQRRRSSVTGGIIAAGVLVIGGLFFFRLREGRLSVRCCSRRLRRGTAVSLSRRL